MLEFLLWLCGINSISAALGHRHSGLGIPCWGSWSLGCNCSSDLIPGMGTSYAPGGQKRKGKNKKRILRFFFIFSPSIFSKATQQLSGWFSHQRRPGELRLYLWAWHPSGNCVWAPFWEAGIILSRYEAGKAGVKVWVINQSWHTRAQQFDQRSGRGFICEELGL